MITLRNLKLNEFEEYKTINLNELKEVLLRWYYVQVYKKNPKLFEQDMERELIITPIRGSYGNISSIVFSVNGSPPKGEAILFLISDSIDYWFGTLCTMGNGRMGNKIELLKIEKDNFLREFYDMDYIIKKEKEDSKLANG